MRDDEVAVAQYQTGRAEVPAFSLSIIVPTIGRPSLTKTLESLRLQIQDGDEIVVVSDGPCGELPEFRLPFLVSGRLVVAATGSRHNDYGATARNVGLMLARGTHVCFLDDDDWFLPEALESVRGGILQGEGALHIFRMRQPGGRVLWKEKEITHGNIGTPMLVHRNFGHHIPLWLPKYGHDFWYAGEVAGWLRRTCWHEEVIAEVGHVPPSGPKP